VDAGRTAIEGIRRMIPPGSDVDLLVLSHTDSDHIGAVPQLMAEYRVKKIVHPTIDRGTRTWDSAIQAIHDERDREGCEDVDLASSVFPAGGSYRYGDPIVFMVAGFNEPPVEWGRLSPSERMNAGSVVIRILYAGKSVLLAGDAVGRHIGDPADTSIASEWSMVQSAGTIPIDCDVLVAPHHGADNASSPAFIRAASPEYVIFSAGHMHDHPQQVAVDRYRAAGVKVSKMFRTDLGDDEGPEEWSRGRIPGGVDRRGDDDVLVTISSAGRIKVRYSR
jgi:glyoxylase-like metal-dependent hydrolase (beta-lactamase superfamily II)